MHQNTPIHRDSSPIRQELSPVHRHFLPETDSTSVRQDSPDRDTTPIHRELPIHRHFSPVHEDFSSVRQDFLQPMDVLSRLSRIKCFFIWLPSWLLTLLCLFAPFILYDVFYRGFELCRNRSILGDILGHKLSPLESVIRYTICS